MQSLSENFLFVWESADLVMSWHAPCLPKWGRKHQPLFFARPPTPSPPLLVNVPYPPKKKQISQWTCIILKLNVTNFLVKLSQLKFLDKNIFVYKLFLSLNISDFSLFFMQKLHPSRKNRRTMLGALELRADRHRRGDHNKILIFHILFFSFFIWGD